MAINDEKLTKEITRVLGGMKVRFKDESRLQKIIGRILKPLVPTYMTTFATTMFGRVYLPSRHWLAQRRYAKAISKKLALLALLNHEKQHLNDSKRLPIIFELSYLVMLPVVFTLRSLWEWRAYKKTIETYVNWIGVLPYDVETRIANNFVKKTYGFMFPFRKRIQKMIRRKASQALAAILKR